MFLKVGGIAPMGAILMGRGAKKHQGGDNAQLLKSIIELTSVSYYYDLLDSSKLWFIISLEFVAKANYLLNFYSGSSICPATVWIISGLRSRRKNVTAPIPELFFSWTLLQLRSSSFHEHGSSSAALGFHERGSGILYFHGSGPARASVCFHTLIF